VDLLFKRALQNLMKKCLLKRRKRKKKRKKRNKNKKPYLSQISKSLKILLVFSEIKRRKSNILVREVGTQS